MPPAETLPPSLTAEEAAVRAACRAGGERLLALGVEGVARLTREEWRGCVEAVLLAWRAELDAALTRHAAARALERAEAGHGG